VLTTAITIIRASLLVLAGSFAAQHSRVLLSSDLCNGLFVASILLIVIGRMRFVAFLLLGFTVFMQAGISAVDAQLEARFVGESMLTRVRIVDFPKITDATVTMLIEPVNDTRLPPTSRVTWIDPPQIPAIGEVWQFELRLRRPRGSSNPGTFSVENWMFREGLHAAGYVVSGKRNRLLGSDGLSHVASYRRDFVRRAQANGGTASGVLAAIGVGTRHLLTPEQWQRYAKTGSSHLMAISGLHIGLAASAAFALVAVFSGVFRLPGNHLDHALVGATTIATGYATVSGFAVPSQRATLMLLLASIALLLRRRPESLRIVAMTALVVFFIDPLASMSPGFSLSFGAVLVLLWSARHYSRPTAGRRIYQLGRMQFELLFGLMPLTVLIFQRIAFVAPVVNLITVPLFSFLTVPLTLASMFLNPLSESVSLLLLKAAAVSVQGVERIIYFFSELRFTDVSIAGAGDTTWLIVLLPLALIVLPRGWPGRWIAVLGVIALILHKVAAPPRDCIDAHVLDVGQGLSVMVRTARHTLLFDTGASYRSGGSAAQRLILPFLKSQKIDTIDWLVVSHADNDHAGGVSALLENIEIGEIIVGEELPSIHRQAVNCYRGLAWEVDGVEFRFLHPNPEQALTGNDASCVLAVSTGGHRLLLTGDIEINAERQLLSHWPFETASVVVIPHHGSLTSSSAALVGRLSPDLAIVSAGYRNRWGLPRDRVTERWLGVGAAVMNTASAGAISLRMCASGGISRLGEERQRRRRFWHDPVQL